MKTIKVDLANRSYNIYTGDHSIKNLPMLLNKSEIGKDAVLITTENLARLYGKKLSSLLKKSCSSVLILKIPDSEKSKNAQLALKLIEKITLFDNKKSIFLIAFGGGVVGDLAGFIASIYKRGVPYIQIPTTFLAQIDSSIGGKTAVDTSFGKNLIGSFHQPRFVLADTHILKTLPISQIKAGLSEAIKYAIIRDEKLFFFIKNNMSRIMAFDMQVLNEIILKCASLKASIVAVDEYDNKGQRIILNFGHTFGHAIEAASHFKISHGEAVAIGMIAACGLSSKLKLLSNKTASEIKELISSAGLPVNAKGINSAAIFAALNYDKKFSQGKNRFVLIRGIGKTKIVKNIPENLLKMVISEDLT